MPVLFTAGRTPTNEDGLAGHRSLDIHWTQEMFDQAGMLRESVKWDYELRNGQQLETVVDRALSIAMSEPMGPVYLALPREVLAHPMNEFTYTYPIAPASRCSVVPQRRSGRRSSGAAYGCGKSAASLPTRPAAIRLHGPLWVSLRNATRYR